jgi:hypothetical protein
MSNAFLITRDTRLIALMRRDTGSEFSYIAELCGDFPMCLRIFPSFIGQLAVDALWAISRIFSSNPDPFLSNSIMVDDRNHFTNFSASYMYRYAIFVLILFLLFKFTQSWQISASILCIFFVSLLAPQTLILRAFISKVEFSQTQELWLISMPSIYLIYYDYFALLLVVFLALFPHLVISMPKLGLVLIGLLLFLSFEFLPLFAFLLFGFLLKGNFLKRVLLLLGPVVTIIAILFFNPIGQQKTLLDTFFYYASSNLKNVAGLFIIVFIVLIVPIFLGDILGIYLRLALNEKGLKQFSSLHKNASAATKSLIIVHLLSLFTSGVTSEFARQSVALQFMLLVLFCSKRVTRQRI